jgi:hypothetical protein
MHFADRLRGRLPLGNRVGNVHRDQVIAARRDLFADKDHRSADELRERASELGDPDVIVGRQRHDIEPPDSRLR